MSPIPEWLGRFLEKRLSDEASTKPYERFIFELAADRELTPTDKFVGTLIWLHADRTTGKNARPGQDLLAWLIGRDIETVRRSTRKLERRGFLSTEHGKAKLSSKYTILVRGHPLRDIPQRTLDELQQIFYPHAGEVSPPHKRGVHPHTGEGGPFHDPSTEPPIYIAVPDDDYTNEVGASSSGMTGRKVKSKKSKREGKALFEFADEERALEAIFDEGDIHDTEDVTDAEIVRTIQRATDGRVGKALLTDDGIWMVRRMMASMMFHSDCSAQTAIECIQGAIWQRIGKTDAMLNSYKLIFARLCAELHGSGGIIDGLVSDEDQLKQCIRADDRSERLHPNLFSVERMSDLHHIIDRYGEDALLQATAAALREPGGSAMPRHHISTWGYFVPVIEENNRRAQMSAAGIAPGDVLGEGLRMDVPF